MIMHTSLMIMMTRTPRRIPHIYGCQRNEEDTKFVRTLVDAIPTKKHPQPVSEQSLIVQHRKKIFKELVKGGMDTQTLSVADQYLRDSVLDLIWHRNTVTFPNGKEWERNQKWLTAPDPQGHEDPVRYLTYGCVFRLVDGRKCLSSYDISDKNTTPRDEYLKNAHKLEQCIAHGKKAVLTSHQSQLQKQEVLVSKYVMTDNRFHQLKTTLFIIQTCQPFSVVENQHLGTSSTKIGFLVKVKVSVVPSGNLPCDSLHRVVSHQICN